MGRLNDDRLGSVTHLTDASGTVVERYRDNPFGSPFIRNGEGWGARIESASDLGRGAFKRAAT